MKNEKKSNLKKKKDNILSTTNEWKTTIKCKRTRRRMSERARKQTMRKKKPHFMHSTEVSSSTAANNKISSSSSNKSTNGRWNQEKEKNVLFCLHLFFSFCASSFLASFRFDVISTCISSLETIECSLCATINDRTQKKKC